MEVLDKVLHNYQEQSKIAKDYKPSQANRYKPNFTSWGVRVLCDNFDDVKEDLKNNYVLDAVKLKNRIQNRLRDLYYDDFSKEDGEQLSSTVFKNLINLVAKEELEG